MDNLWISCGRYSLDEEALNTEDIICGGGPETDTNILSSLGTRES